MVFTRALDLGAFGNDGIVERRAQTGDSAHVVAIGAWGTSRKSP